MSTFLTPAAAEDISSWFKDHILPENAIVADVYVLDLAKRTQIADFLSRELPDCFISKDDIDAQINRTGMSIQEIVQNKFADPGSVMAGDFGEILSLFFLGSAGGHGLKKVKKWRFKQDRNKPAPHSDVILLHCTDPEHPHDDDFLICAEAKVKSTASKTYRPIANALEGYESDRTGRLAKTLAWLREKAIESDTAYSIKYIERFSKDQIRVPYHRRHRAIAVIDSDFLDAELVEAVTIPTHDGTFKIVVMAVAELKALYEECFKRAVAEAKHG
ncbi:DUF1837 domain-containing protein [Rhizobium leguminosarum]|uniref:Hachiman antiphage defense system protein HamA n=1 Tax=Rhizobium leguminosarum TaxID=384 RepID=UPI001C97AB59|nr:Hachiman antiphage defense system protein HamA [Rhizobium leguminosarum]MBY5539245.1 DUF1837 domain-containing protein [Rhizobium leguminosarum]